MGGGLHSYERGTSEALGQLGQDEPASGMASEPLDGLCPYFGPQTATAPPSRHRCLYRGTSFIRTPSPPRTPLGA